MTTYRLLIRLGGTIVLLLIVLGVYGFWFSMVEKRSSDAANVILQIAHKRNDASEASRAKQQLASLSTDQASVSQYLVSANGIVPFLESLQSTGTYFGATVQVASVSAVPGKPYGHLELALKIMGPFNSVMRTVGAIEYQPYDTSVTAVTFTSTPKSETSAATWTATMNVSVGTDADAAPSKTPVPASTQAPVTSPAAQPAATSTPAAPQVPPAQQATSTHTAV